MNDNILWLNKLVPKHVLLKDSEIEEKLNNYSIIENDELAVSLSSGRYAAMKLTKLIGKEDTIQFFQDCIETASKT